METPHSDEPLVPDHAVSLDCLALIKGETFVYTYDAGDDWRHMIRVTGRTKVSGEEAWLSTVQCLGGKRAGQPENCGGPGGYAELIHALAIRPTNRTAEEAEYASWAGRWKPEKFDIEAVNKKLTKR